MRDILLTVKRQRTEIVIFIVCFLVAFGLNLYSIVAFGTEWKELYTQLLWVLCLSVLFYGIVLFLRLLYWGIQKILHKK
ncbi:hypothetical protein D0T51_02330 [Parabacteroides sp. 52]|uniref:hypothetical protein n=1 Tax=unclassified Parabacteroides TaxID=2649774 RepID=UPI0013D695CF|nr:MULTISPECIES: hypothetical protein [unclassified Parabacteroides]MDH6533822.1 formate hydrogenlyase subunit 4 [Parabacteroides sp. PM5-20]NDV54572.1 hypothetical protein [Parabacteroides sp. 52]